MTHQPNPPSPSEDTVANRTKITHELRADLRLEVITDPALPQSMDYPRYAREYLEDTEKNLPHSSVLSPKS